MQHKPDQDPSVTPPGNIPGNMNAVNSPLNLLELFEPDDFPASKMDLIIYAGERGASEDVLDELQAIPDDIYDSIAELNPHLGEMEIIEDRGGGDLWASEESSDLSNDQDRALTEFMGKGRL